MFPVWDASGIWVCLQHFSNTSRRSQAGHVWPWVKITTELIWGADLSLGTICTSTIPSELSAEWWHMGRNAAFLAFLHSLTFIPYSNPHHHWYHSCSRLGVLQDATRPEKKSHPWGDKEQLELRSEAEASKWADRHPLQNLVWLVSWRYSSCLCHIINSCPLHTSLPNLGLHKT